MVKFCGRAIGSNEPAWIQYAPEYWNRFYKPRGDKDTTKPKWSYIKAIPGYTHTCGFRGSSAREMNDWLLICIDCARVEGLEW